VIAIHPQYAAARSSIRSSLPKIAENFNNKTSDVFANMATDRVLEKMKEIVDGVVQKGGDIATLNESTGCPTSRKASSSYFAAQEMSGVVENDELHTKSSRN
jgi:hypothetical protein